MAILTASTLRPGGCLHPRVLFGVPSSFLAQLGSSPDIRRVSYSSSPERKWTLLYHRSPQRSTPPRAMLGLSTFNLTYWTWYVSDFVPSVNASAYEKAALGQIDQQTLDLLQIDPNMGYVGCGIASIIFLGSYFYSKQLVSAIWAPKDGADEKCPLAVSTLSLPLLRQPKILDKTVYDPESNAFHNVGSIEFSEEELRSDSSIEFFAPGELTLSEEQRKHDVIVKFDGKFSRLKGHIALKKEDGGTNDGLIATLQQQRYLLDIESEQEVMLGANSTLLHSLVLKDYHMDNNRKLGKSSKRDEPNNKRKRRSRNGH